MKKFSNLLPKDLKTDELALKEAIDRTIGFMHVEMSLPLQQKLMEYSEKRINEIRADIVSGEKTNDEINGLLDELQKTTIVNYHAKTRVTALKHMHEKCDKTKTDEAVVKVTDEKLELQKEI